VFHGNGNCEWKEDEAITALRFAGS
jgi:hypothetical protein